MKPIIPVTRIRTLKGLTMVLGDFRTGLADRSEVAQGFARVVLHGGYDPRTIGNDIAMIKLRVPMKSTDYIRPVCLPTQTAMFGGKGCVVTGWGTTRLGELPCALKQYAYKQENV